MKDLYKHLVSIILFILASFAAFAQEGIIRGTIIEEATGEPLFGVTVVIKGTTTGSVTDFDGKFEIRAEQGTYTIQASFVSFKTVTIEGLEVNADKVTIIDNILMTEAVEQLAEVVVTAEVLKTTESALMTVKKKSVSLLDGISAANFRKIGDSNAGSAAKRVTGVSVEGGKYVYVRGLGDRYTKTMLNNATIPGLDPDRNSIQIDIFPTSLIDNLIVLKSFTADLPADFTGGIVNIETKDFPEEKIFEISAGVGFNPSMHFNSEYLNYNGGSTDFLGFDDGERELPNIARQGAIPLPFQSNDGEVNAFLNDFSPTLDAVNETSFMNYNFSLTYGNQVPLKNGNTLGYIFSGNYSNSTQFFDEVFIGEYQRPSQPDEFELVYGTIQEGKIAENEVLLGGLAGIAYKTELSKFKFNLMHLQNGTSRSAEFFIDDNGDAVGKSGFIANSDNLEYNQRAMTNAFLNGTHFNKADTWEVDWRTAVTLSTLDDPDIRKTAFTVSNRNTPIFTAGAAGLPSRLWREMDEINAVGKLDITRKLQLFGEDAKLKFGGSYIYKERDYEILTFDVNFIGTTPEWSGNPSEVWAEEILWPTGPLSLTAGNDDPDTNPNKYNSSVQHASIYISSEFTILDNLKAILGVRGENYVQNHTGRDQQASRVLDDEEVLNSFDLFPTANFIYSLNDNQNLRLAYSRTIARPSFKELSFAQILDPVSNRTFSGGLIPVSGSQGIVWDGNLTETRINNFDIRWEYFMKRGQLFSISAFLKTFNDPIELVTLPAAQTTLEFQPRNVGDATVFGAEVELRKNLDFISESLSNFSFNTNFTIVESIVDMTSTEFDARKRFEKNGETVEDTREMTGQAPWIINAGVSYANYETGLEAGLFYNVKGETLYLVGGGLFPDVYSEPFHSLNFNLNKTFGADEKLRAGLKIDNILNDKREQFFQAFQATNQVYSSLNPGTTISLSAGYRF